MEFAELEREVEKLGPEQRRRLLQRLVAEEGRRHDAGRAAEMTRRLEDGTPGAWIPLEEAKRRLGDA